MASEGTNETKGKGRNNDTTQQTITVTFVSETDRYERPNNMEEHIRSYFEGINGINKRIIAEERKIIAQNRNTWPTLTVEERDILLNDRLISSNVRQKYNANDDYWRKKTPWRPEELMAPNLREERSDSVSNDSFSTPFHWATKSQRNLHFPEIKTEMLKNDKVKEQQRKPLPSESSTKEELDQTVKKLSNVEKSLKEKQIKTKNDNIKGNIEESNSSKPTSAKSSDSKPRVPKNNTYDSVPQQDQLSSEQPKDEKQCSDETNNIFEFLQSWNP